MTPKEISAVYHFDVCPRCHDIMPTDKARRAEMHTDCALTGQVVARLRNGAGR